MWDLPNLSVNDLSVLSEALNMFVASAEKSIPKYVEREDAVMLLTTMKERETARDLLDLVWAVWDHEEKSSEK